MVHKKAGNLIEMYMSRDYMVREWNRGALDFLIAIDISYYNFFFPLNFVQRLYFLYKTNRPLSNIFVLGYKIDLVLFILVIQLHYEFYKLMNTPIMTAIDLG